MKLSEIKPNPNNPRVIRDDKFAKLKKSIEDFPKMMELRPIVVDNTMTILGGNMRFRALQDLGYKELPKEWVKKADKLTDEEKQRFIIEDNVGFGEWNWEQLANEWDVERLAEWGLDVPEFNSMDDIEDLSSKIEKIYRIEIICKDEEHQEKTYNKLIEQGHQCRILTL